MTQKEDNIMEEQQEIDTTKKKIKWLPLEGNPEVSSSFVHSHLSLLTHVQ
jgi:hypothetical protein